ncbi:MAG: aldehyde dehydrogenase family protein, partial [Anaerolineales bacterium]|nr:aldehyde dehydrogenase family protein [Anaerolineales bacterium]
MTQNYGLFINNQEVPATSGETFASYAPATGAVVGYAARARTDDVEQAVHAARHAFSGWAGLPPAERERIMLKCADAIESKREHLMNVLIDESGSTLVKARYEAMYTANLFRAAAGEARRLYGDTFPNDKPHRMSLVTREPLGVVLVISPFNAPLVLLTKMIVFA